jgi:hypothetical protein
VSWSSLVAGTCGFAVGVAASVQCVAASKNMTAPLAALSDGAIAGIIVGLAVAIAVAVTVYCCHVVKTTTQSK